MQGTLDDLDKKARRRLYDCKKQKKKVDELRKLQNLVTDLVAKASQLKYFKQSMLPWKEIAIALGRETAESFDSNRMLRGDLFQLENLAADMSRWVAVMSHAPTVPVLPARGEAAFQPALHVAAEI
ncbi:hypothetical protein AaE_007107 [Aphanomyces astaci]|uniref:Uncharacterized protein n=1 Tax=Aphanomyces astaci TaxID=112090 RepID=A0A6A5AHM2_APHAT|nr:hypothetical protein AaE_007107 [Aphanomyces astaci]